MNPKSISMIHKQHTIYLKVKYGSIDPYFTFIYIYIDWVF